MKYAALLVLAGSLAACTSDQAPPPAPETQAQPAIYGSDDRQDVYAHPSADLRALAQASIAAMFDPSAIDASNPNNVRLYGASLQDAMGVCSDERFADQPTGADCSATLIDDDLILTAGHCVTSDRDCAQAAFVFNYYMESASSLATVTSNDVYQCEELLVQAERDLDYAILRLDRTVVGHTPAPVNASTNPVSNGDSVTIIGFGSGLPAKIDNGGHVSDARASAGDYFYASTDSFGGNSGSGVFDTAGRVVGILVFGADDYYNAGGCNRVVTYNDAEGGEGVTYAYRAVQALCATGYPSEVLCGTTGSCGDGVCAGGETEASCPADCSGGTEPGEWVCDTAWYGTGDGCDCACGSRDPDCDDPNQELYNCEDGQYCDASGACADRPSAPASWTCEPSYYGSLDGCDCNCGAYDPDCDVAGQDVYNCEDGQYCTSAGVCADGTGPDEDTGVPTEDTGVPTEDTGVTETDTGVVDTDTGVEEPDTGVSGEDTAVPSDTGVSDTSGVFENDGNGGSESGCSSTPARRTPWLGLLGLALVWRRRR